MPFSAIPGAAILEGGVYGAEYILAGKAAYDVGASIILADRPTHIGNSRLQARLENPPMGSESPNRRGLSLEPHPHPAGTASTSLARSVDEPAVGDGGVAAIVAAAESLMRRSLSGLSASSAAVASEAKIHWRRLSQSRGDWFGCHMHPIFGLSAAGGLKGHESALLRAGGESPAEVFAAVERVLADGCVPGGEIALEDLSLVRRAITLLDMHAHERLRAAYVPTHGITSSGTNALPAGPSPEPGLGPGPEQADACRENTSASGAYSRSAPAMPGPALRPADPGSVEGPEPAGGTWCGAADGLWRRYTGSGRGDLPNPLVEGGGSYADRAYFRTVVRERDLILARELWMQAGQPGVSKVGILFKPSGFCIFLP